jgi:hypothetical protein
LFGRRYSYSTSRPAIRRVDVEMRKSPQPQLPLALAERAQPQGVELDEAGGVAMIAGNRPHPLNAGAFQLLSLSSLKMGEPSPLDSKPVSE